MKKTFFAGLALVVASSLPVAAIAADKPVGITFDTFEVTVKHNGKDVVVKRDQNPDAVVIDAFAKTSRACPPFCIQPIKLAPGVETIGEAEMIDYMVKAGSDDSILIIDSRTPNWVERGTIPGAKNLPWTDLSTARGADPLSIGEILTEEFGAEEFDGLWKFGNAKTLVMFCNGMWCGQSPTNIKSLLDFGYPAHKMKWYRGGMQNWSNLGLTTVKP